MIEVRKTPTFSDWMARLRDHRARAKIAARIDRLALSRQQERLRPTWRIEPWQKKKIKTSPYDSAEYLDSAEPINAYIEEALEMDDPVFIAKALGTIARARGMSQITGKAGLSRESLWPRVQRATRNLAPSSA